MKTKKSFEVFDGPFIQVIFCSLLGSCDDDRLKGTVMNLGIIATKENGENKRPWNSFSPNRRKLKCFEALPNDEFSCNSKEVPQEQCKSAHEF